MHNLGMSSFHLLLNGITAHWHAMIGRRIAANGTMKLTGVDFHMRPTLPRSSLQLLHQL